MMLRSFFSILITAFLLYAVPMPTLARGNDTRTTRKLKNTGKSDAKRAKKKKSANITISPTIKKMAKKKWALEHLSHEGIEPEQYDTELINRLKAGDTQTAAALVTVGATLNRDEKEKDKPLLLAAEHGEADLVYLMLIKGADINCTDNQIVNNNALHYAAKAGKADMIHILVEAGLSPIKGNKQGWTVLHEACKAGQLETARLLIEEYGANIRAQTMTCQIPLFMACASGNLELVKYMVKKGSDIHHIACAGHTAMIWAAQSGKDDCVRYLIDLGCDINVFKIRWGGGAPHYAAEKCSTETVAYMLKKGGDFAKITYKQENALLQAAEGKNKETVKLLIQHGLRLNNLELIPDAEMRQFIKQHQQQ